MHENLDRVEEIKVSSDRSFGIVFTLVFLAVGIWMVSGGQSDGRLFFVGSAFFLLLPYVLNLVALHFISKNSG